MAEFNSDITEGLLEGALSFLSKNSVKKESIKIVWVPGAFEIPYLCQQMAKKGQYDALIALGCVIKGQTDHYYYIADQAARGIMEASLKYEIPIGFGVVTTNNLKQARARSNAGNNKGAEAAAAVLKVINIL